MSARKLPFALGIACLATCLPSCTLISAVDVCARGVPDDVEINVRAEGAQAVSGAHPAAALPDGGALVVFRSALAADDDGMGPAALRVALLDAEGRPAERTCDAPGEYEIVAQQAGLRADEASIAMPGDADEEVGLIVYSVRSATGRTLRGVFVSRTGCRRGLIGDQTFAISDTAPNNAASEMLPSVVWLGARMFLVGWTASSLVPPLEIRSVIRARVVRASATFTAEFQPTVLDAAGASVAVSPSSAVQTGGLVTALGPGRAGISWSEQAGRTSVPHFMAVDDRLETLIANRSLDEVVYPDIVRIPNARSRGAAFDGSQIIVGWTGIDTDGRNRVTARYFDETGANLASPQSPDGAPFLVRDDVPPEDEGRVSMAPLEGGGFLVAMEQLGGGDGRVQSITARLFGPSGGSVFANPACDARSFPLVESDGDVADPALERLADGSTLLVYTSDGASGSDRSGTGVRAAVWQPRLLLPLP
jgi:hypothetical protein